MDSIDHFADYPPAWALSWVDPARDVLRVAMRIHDSADEAAASVHGSGVEAEGGERGIFDT